MRILKTWRRIPQGWAADLWREGVAAAAKKKQGARGCASQGPRALTIAVNTAGTLWAPLASKGMGNRSGWDNSVPSFPSALQRPLLVEWNTERLSKANCTMRSPAPGPQSRTEKGAFGAERQYTNNWHRNGEKSTVKALHESKERRKDFNLPLCLNQWADRLY